MPLGKHTANDRRPFSKARDTATAFSKKSGAVKVVKKLAAPPPAQTVLPTDS